MNARRPAPHPRPRRGVLGWAAVFLAGIFFLPPAAETAGQGALVDTSVRKTSLDNGLTVVTQTDPVSTVTVVEILIRGGARADPADRAGRSYLATRLAMDIQDPSTARDFMVKALRYSMTSRDDDAVIHLECLTEFIDEALASFLKILTDPLLTGIRIDRLTEYMNHQRRIQADDAVNESRLAQREVFFGGTGYAGSIYGTEESLRSLKSRVLKDYYNRRFIAGNMIVAAVSDLPPDDLHALIKRRFNGLRPGNVSEPETPVSPKNPSSGPLRIEKDQQQSVVSCAFLLPPLTRKDYVLWSLIENILGRGPGSKLWGLRTEKKLAYQVTAVASRMRAAGLLEAYLETDAAKTESAREALASVLGEFRDQGITAEEFEAGRAVLRAQYLRTNETKANRTTTLGFFEISGLGAEFYATFTDELAALTLEETNEAIRLLLDPARASWVIVGPKL